VDQGEGKKKKPRKCVLGPDGKERIYARDVRFPTLTPKAEHVQHVLAGIAAKIGGDHTQDLARILRLPGTLNRKDQRNGVEPVPCVLVECEAERRYPLADFERFAEADPAQVKAREAAKVRLPSGKKLTAARRNTLNDYVNKCLLAPVGERSEADFHLYCWAIRQGLDQATVWSEVQDAGKFQERGQDYFDRTWEKAADRVKLTLYKQLTSPPRKSNGVTHTPVARGGDGPEPGTPVDESAEATGQHATDRYAQHNGRTCLIRRTEEETEYVPLAEFTARIAEQIVHDDGQEQRRVFAIEGELPDGTSLPRIEVPAAEFEAMAWPVANWGSPACIHVGTKFREHLRAAIMMISERPPTRTVYTHTGWREVNGQRVFLNGGGAIGAGGVVPDVCVVLPGQLDRFVLPAPPEEEQQRSAVRASLGFLDLGPPRLTVPLLAAAFRAVLGNSDFSGRFKSETAALVQQHFGVGMDRLHLPANWDSTANSLQILAFAAKDVILVVDDFVPKGATADVHRLHKEADRLLRAQGNQAGRNRAAPDGTLRPEKHPRGLILSTGEEAMRGGSLVARVLGLEFEEGDIRQTELTRCQKDAAAGLYAAAMAGFVRWLAPQLPQVRRTLREEHARLRDQATADGQHARTPGIVADLALGWRYFLDFAQGVGAVTPAERGDLWRQGWDALGDAAAAQARHVAGQDVVDRFLRLMRSALTGGYAHLAGKNGNLPPGEQAAYGWREQDGASYRWQPQGRCIGWVSGEDVFLDPEMSYLVAKEMASKQEEPLAAGQTTLHKRLDQKKLLVTKEDKRGYLTVRKTLQGARRAVLHLRLNTLLPAGDPKG
jgi:hypothetical protein